MKALQIWCLALGLCVSLSACEKEQPLGACEVEYDMLGTKGEACTQTKEDQCNDNVQPSMGLASLKKKNFHVAKTCADVGHKTAGCSDIPLAWTFKGKCPN